MKRILIANRGEIAVRIIRSARESGYTAVAVYADQDADALHVQLADEALALHGTTSGQTYLDQGKLLDAARQADADAIHPGYGFLSENADFARAVREAGLTWIGPRPETIESLGNKVTARALAVRVGAPLVPGTDGPVASSDEIRAFVAEHGLPVAIKAAHGGGGRGMRIVREEAEIDEAFASAVREAESAFGRGECFVERFLDRPRHVEAQVLADEHGSVVVVGTRDCSLQRRNQKLVEEAPAPFLSDDQRAEIHRSARAICAEAGYVGAGTVEYLLSPGQEGRPGLLSFLEVNTRLQVEHPVTEETSGVDLVSEQLRIAEGHPLRLTEDPQPTGHSVEFRLNAEEPAHGFLPTPGPVEVFAPPTGPGIRVDTGVRSGDEVSGAFDSMLAKLIVTGPDRATTLRRAQMALAEMRIEGLPTVLPFHRQVLEAEDFLATEGAAGFRVHTRWIETEFDAAFGEGMQESEHMAAALRHREQAMRRTTVEIDGHPVTLGLPGALVRLLAGGQTGATGEDAAADGAPAGPGEPGEGAVTTKLAGSLVRWSLEDGAGVSAGDAVAVVEAMKMESTVAAPSSGTFSREELQPGAALKAGQVLGRID
ncbi:acetyl/propionyl/methylcrotonyl-CoA carboxylase subunit alpha [Nesterenkonia halotolerans]|uniref:biotin carboxylase n=1 Tax=Nesterenkonia halotolerans TaxID=225325 RepID=A0ABR9J958_9MICC|nr:biotin carboxylase N-terminal domain-containing protein [Nesterenkonia halotolerans]MBE1515529.1 acetyl-CoA/propionyl-CoA carboxylase biotin carboxyl carrier protein [Nesterenkonia halotolerans]